MLLQIMPFFCGQIFITWPKKSIANHIKDFCEKNMPKLPDFEDFFFLKSSDLDNRFQQVANI
jgi:hypothetical protein